MLLKIAATSVYSLLRLVGIYQFAAPTVGALQTSSGGGGGGGGGGGV